MKYRKLPVVINAWLASELNQTASKDWGSLPPEVRTHYDVGNVLFLGDNSIEIKTLEGWHKANPDDMVICGVHGELYPCKPDIFAKTYEAAE